MCFIKKNIPVSIVIIIFEAYNLFYDVLHDAGMPSTSWLKAIDDGKFYIPSNDFSCMISKEMYDDIFLPGIIEECAFYDRSIYHLDGPGALKHLDSLLEIDDLDGIQWVPGEGNGFFEEWIHVYKKIQEKGKCMDIHTLSLNSLPLLFENLVVFDCHLIVLSKNPLFHNLSYFSILLIFVKQILMPLLSYPVSLPTNP
jgi:hypothetical protein